MPHDDRPIDAIFADEMGQSFQLSPVEMTAEERASVHQKWPDLSQRHVMDIKVFPPTLDVGFADIWYGTGIPIRTVGSYPLELQSVVQHEDDVDHQEQTLLNSRELKLILDVVAQGEKRVLIMHSAVAIRNQCCLPVHVRVSVNHANGTKPRVRLPACLKSDADLIYLPVWAVHRTTLISWSFNQGATWSEEIALRHLFTECGAHLHADGVFFSAQVHSSPVVPSNADRVPDTVATPAISSLFHIITLQPHVRLNNSLPVDLQFRLLSLPLADDAVLGQSASQTALVPPPLSLHARIGTAERSWCVMPANNP